MRWQKAFLAAFASGGVVSHACDAAGISRVQAYRTRRANPEFAAAWDAALEEAADALETEARRRAFAGSDLLLMFLLKGYRPDRFREKVTIAPHELDKLIERELTKLKGAEEEELVH